VYARGHLNTHLTVLSGVSEPLTCRPTLRIAATGRGQTLTPIDPSRWPDGAQSPRDLRGRRSTRAPHPNERGSGDVQACRAPPRSARAAKGYRRRPLPQAGHREEQQKDLDRGIPSAKLDQITPRMPEHRASVPRHDVANYVPVTLTTARRTYVDAGRYNGQ
jgi:hypothetical protein